MPPAPLPPDEAERLKSLRALGVLDTPPEERFDALTRQARRALGVPIALISLVDEQRQWFKSRTGLDLAQTPRDQAFCAYAILGSAPLVVPDAAKDPRFSDNPLVVGSAGIRFYAGVPLSAPDGRKIGTLCVLDRVPRSPSDAQMRVLMELARQAERELAAGPARAENGDAGAARVLTELRRSPRRRTERRRIVGGFALAAVALAVAAALSLSSVKRLRADAAWVNHTHEVLETLYRLRADELAAGAAARDYARSGDERLSADYAAQRDAALDAAENARWMTTDDPDQQVAVVELRRALHDRFAVADSLIQMRDRRGAAGGALSAESASASRAVDARLDVVRRREEGLLDLRRKRAYLSARRVGSATGAAALFALALIGWALYALNRDLDGRLAAQAAAQTQSARLTAVLDSMENGVIVIDAEGRRLLSNPAAERILGSGLVRVDPARWSELCRYTDPDGIAPLPHDQRPISRALAGETVNSLEFMIRYPERADGIVILASSAPVRGLEGEVLGAVVAFQDVTARRRAERRRALQYEVTRALIQAGADNPMPALLEYLCRGLGWGFAEYWELGDEAASLRRRFVWSEPGAALKDFISEGNERLFGPGEGLPGRAWAGRAPLWVADVVADPQFPRAAAAARAGLHGALAFPVFQGERLFGVVCAFNWSAESPDEELLALAASLGGQIGLFLDRRRAQAAEARAAAERQAVLDAATSVAIVSTDVDGTIRLFNAGAERMLGYKAEDLSNKSTVAALFTRAEIKARRKELAARGLNRAQRALLFAGEALLTGGTETREWLLRRKDGSLVPVQLIVTVIRGPEGLAEGFLGIASDIAARRAAEEEMARARDLAMHAARVKSDFLANMSHEIRTPMNAIIGMTGLLMQTGLDARQREYAQTAHAAGEALLAVVNDILDFSKIEAGKLSVESIPFDLRSVVEGAAALVGERARAKGLELTVSVPPDLPAGLRGDPHRLSQVLLNLLSNAIKFTEAGDVVVCAERLPDAGGRLRLRLSVRDTGIGIPPEARKELFGSFTQADASTTRRFGGTGLGLAISKRLVELMGGDVGVDSAQGRGSTFWCDLPFDLAPEGADVGAPRADLQGLKVLVVDDNEVNRRVLRRQLESWRMSGEDAPSGARALELLRAAAAEGSPYALALLDMRMPGMDGLELARRLRDEPPLAGTRAILLSSSASAPDDAQRAELGLSAALTKPVRQSALLDAISSALAAGARGSIRPDAAHAPAPAAPRVLVRRRCRILVVDDNAVNRRIAALLLESLGYGCEAFPGAHSALARLESGPAELVLLDCQMPEMDGYAAAGEIRAREAAGRPRTTIVAMTAHALEGDREKCLAAGMDDYVAKPVRAEDLARVLARWDPALDAALVADLRAVAGAEMPALVKTFIDHAEKSCVELDAALARADFEAVKKLTHGLRGSAGSFGASGVRALAVLIEADASRGDADAARAAAAELPAELARAARALAAA
ncbi:MAG: response regulator [Elusimicrobia bacterium]|nr:response regulator [Elusimicrobiota bacterium]